MISDLATTKPRAIVKPAPKRPSWLQLLQRREAILIPLGIALISRIIVLVAADLILRFGLQRLQLKLLHVRHPQPFIGPLEVWQRKDALWYIIIAQAGYNYSPVAQSRANFFPLYPALIYLVAPVAKLLHSAEPYAVAGMAISWVSFAIACVLLYQIALRRFGKGVAIGAITLLCVFPFSFYYGAAYTESIYLVLAAGAFLAVERGNWWIAATLAGVASASRPPGLLIGACVALAYFIDWMRTRHPLRLDVLALALTPLGTLSYMLYCYVRWGDPLAYIKTSRAGWNGGHLQIGGVRYVAHVLRHPISWIGTRDPDHILAFFAIMVMLVFLAGTLLVWRLLGPVYALFTLASILAPILDFPSANSLGRYLSVIFPIFIVAAYVLRDHPRLRWTLYIVSLLLLVPFAVYFIAGYGLS